MSQFIGTVLHDRYRIQSLLGRQTGRRTFLAHDLQTEATVVIKLLLFTLDFDWDDLKLFEREAAVLRSLNHPDIPRYLDDFEIKTELGQGFALVQTYIEARSLQDWVKSGRTFSEQDLKAIAKAILNILIYLHSRQPPVIHRDLKPTNILLGNRSGNHPGQVYLVDFGSVQTVIHQGTRTIVGTYGYMPPEQFGGQAVLNSDLYALGATLIYLATGQHPDQFPQREMRILFDNRVRLSPALLDWLKWLTEPSANLRPKSAKQALEALLTSTLRNDNLDKHGKPAGSRIQVTQTRQALEIVILPRGSYIRTIVYIGPIIGWNYLMGIWYWGAFEYWSSFGWAIALFTIGHLGYGLWMIWRLILFDWFGQVRLRITESEIVRRREVFGIRGFPLVAARHSITKIEAGALYKKDVEGDHVPIPPYIDIWAGTQNFRLGEGDSFAATLTLPERDWLAQILSGWLDLPITRY